MADERTFRTVLVQLRLHEEATCRRLLNVIRRELDQARAMISAIEEAIANCTAAGVTAQRDGNDQISRGNRREARGLTLLRAQHVGQLAGIKARLAHCRAQWIEAVQRREALGLLEFADEIQPSVQPRPREKANQVYAVKQIYVQEATVS